MKTRTIFDGTGAAIAGLFYINPEFGGPVAQQFDTGETPVVLNRLQLALGDLSHSDGGTITVHLCADNHGVPGAAIATLGTIPIDELKDVGTLYDLAIAHAPALDANTQYWIELTTTSSTTGAYWLVTDDAAATGATVRPLYTGKGVQAGKQVRMTLSGTTAAIATDALSQHTDDLLSHPDPNAMPLEQPRDGGGATVIFDDSADNFNSGYVVSALFGPAAQSFDSGAVPIALTDLKLDLECFPDSGTITIELCQDADGSPGQSIATLATIPDSDVSSTPSFYDLSITDSPTLSPDTTYWIELSESNSSRDLSWACTTDPTGTAANQSLYTDGVAIPGQDYLMTLSGDDVLFDDSQSGTASSFIVGAPFGSPAQSFNSGSNTIVLTDLKLDLRNEFGSTGTIFVNLCNDAGGTPGTVDQLLGGIPESDLSQGAAFYDLAISNSPTLAADTTYWIELTTSGGSFLGAPEWLYTSTPTGTGLTGQELWNGSQTEPGSDFLMTLSGTCFAAGTRILTARGEIPIENLRPNDIAVALLTGRLTPVLWIGHRHLDLRRHPNPENANPVRVRAHAFGENAPHTDLILSPNHALYVDGSLIAVRYLINGATIVQEERDEIDYYHVELDTHDVLLANGLPAESFLDVGNRGNFANGGALLTLHPNFAEETWAEKSCAPSLDKGEPLQALRTRMCARAQALGHTTTQDPDLRILARGQILRPVAAGPDLRVDLPPGTQTVRLLSRSARPTDTQPDAADGRTLGVGLTALALDGEPCPLDHPRFTTGWHKPEPTIRWTQGDATLHTASARTLTLRLHPGLTYWTEPPAPQAERAWVAGRQP